MKRLSKNRQKKSLLVMLLVLVVFIIMAYILFTPQAIITRHVEHNSGNIREASEFYLEQRNVNKSFDKKSDVMGIYGETNRIVQFYYRCFGIDWPSKEQGYYYSPDDVAVPYCGEAHELVEVSEDEWYWQGDGNQRGKVKKIEDQLYYYEVSL